jgi:hypothetical protein
VSFPFFYFTKLHYNAIQLTYKLKCIDSIGVYKFISLTYLHLFPKYNFRVTQFSVLLDKGLKPGIDYWITRTIYLRRREDEGTSVESFYGLSQVDEFLGKGGSSEFKESCLPASESSDGVAPCK